MPKNAYMAASEQQMQHTCVYRRHCIVLGKEHVMTDREVPYIVRANAINRGSDRYITHIGGRWGLAMEEDAIRDISFGFHTYYISSIGGRIDIEIAEGVIRKYLKTASDRQRPDILLSLPKPLSGVQSFCRIGPRFERLLNAAPLLKEDAA
jgi:hypothetical protein